MEAVFVSDFVAGLLRPPFLNVTPRQWVIPIAHDAAPFLLEVVNAV